ncbi:hypothetical protein [Henriciella marina]|uniref:Uncharacterized protein n=1 Tax=Henriciella marina TaxID=453851 RepID=A0ABT4LUU9_9PROT|nr:hypothetical protein [Henriciella marina]MCH2457045.1 hypothetical protein [Henriciella sp.]MCZ4297953.1 hypothetical protein [Henriciella marina]
MAAKETTAERDARLKAALRDNLKRRKQAARKAKDAPTSKENEEDPDV